MVSSIYVHWVEVKYSQLTLGITKKKEENMLIVSMVGIYFFNGA